MDTKIGEVENKFPNVSGLATTDVLNTKLGKIENAIPDLSKIVKKKKDYDAKRTDIEGEYFIAADYSIFTSEIPDAKIKQKMVNKSYISNLVKHSSLNKKLWRLAVKAELKVEQDKTVKLRTHDVRYFLDENFFGDDGF